ncbi:hypothetical protein GN278_02690 [Rhodobacteraceae bacterium Araon29]
MSEAVWSIIKYKPKAGCEDEFKENGLTRLAEIMNKPDIVWSLIELDTGEIVQISRLPSIDTIVEGQIEGLEWLDTVDHLLEKDAEGSRTQAYSGLEMDAPHSFQSK